MAGNVKNLPSDESMGSVGRTGRRAAPAADPHDIGALPAAVNPERKAMCEKDFRLFCETYFPESFSLAWSEDHLKVIARIEECVLRGGLFALAMSRGSGKSTLAECAAIWALLYGHREFVFIVGASQAAAIEMLDSIKTEFEINGHLAEDFPEVCVPIAALDGIVARARRQVFLGRHTNIVWGKAQIVLPDIPDSRAAGAIVRVAGITGRIRGAKFKRPDGRAVRPSFVIVDDPQTADSAGSLIQTRKRIRILCGDILGLAGPGQKISAVMPCTVIRPGDLADRMLDREEHPDWNGEKSKLVYSMPKNRKLWEQYADIRAESLRTEHNIAAATEFYRQHRAEMDEGARVSWPARFNEDEISALQHAMNLKFQDEASFMSEYQNEPYLDSMPEEETLDPELLMQKINRLPMGRVPLCCNHVTAFIDIQKPLLFYTVAAWADDFTGAVIEYGAWPEQHAESFHLHNATPTIQDRFPDAGLEGGIYNALDALAFQLMNREWEREDGAMLRIERAMIDANWGQSTDVVYRFCRQSPWSGILYPAHGRYVGAGSIPMTEYRKHPGDRIGFNWIIPGVKGKRITRHVLFDSNFWKSFVHARLAMTPGDHGSLGIWGTRPEQHRLFAEHLVAEYRVRTTGRGRCVDEWKLRPDHKDNHWLDCLAGCAVCASMLGCSLPAHGPRPSLPLPQGRTIRLSRPSAPMADPGPDRIHLSGLQRRTRPK